LIASKRRPLIGMSVGSYAGSTPAYRISGRYAAALATAGAAPVAVPLDLPEDALRTILERLDGLCLTGGVDIDPAHYGEIRHSGLGSVDDARDLTELALARWALAADLPVLGICRGIQLLNVAAGGSLYQDINAQLPEAGCHNFDSTGSRERATHRVRLAPGSRLAGLLGVTELMTNSFHHQAVKRPADGFAAVAWADDGVVEGIEEPYRWFAMGVQWHPEEMFSIDPLARRLFEAFVDASRQGSRERK
jgi:putative glutamine amidotransferase